MLDWFPARNHRFHFWFSTVVKATRQWVLRPYALRILRPAKLRNSKLFNAEAHAAQLARDLAAKLPGLGLGQIGTDSQWTQHIHRWCNASDIFRQQLVILAESLWNSHCGMCLDLVFREWTHATSGDIIEQCTYSFSKNQEGLRVPPVLKQTLGLDQLNALERQ